MIEGVASKLHHHEHENHVSSFIIQNVLDAAIGSDLQHHSAKHKLAACGALCES